MLATFIDIKPSLFCSDLSYWRNKTCYSGSDLIYNGSKTQLLDPGDPLYTESRWCATYETNTFIENGRILKLRVHLQKCAGGTSVQESPKLSITKDASSLKNLSKYVFIFFPPTF